MAKRGVSRQYCQVLILKFIRSFKQNHAKLGHVKSTKNSFSGDTNEFAEDDVAPATEGNEKEATIGILLPEKDKIREEVSGPDSSMGDANGKAAVAEAREGTYEAETADSTNGEMRPYGAAIDDEGKVLMKGDTSRELSSGDPIGHALEVNTAAREEGALTSKTSVIPVSQSRPKNYEVSNELIVNKVAK